MLTNNFVKTDLKHPWKSKGTSSRKRSRTGGWMSAKAFKMEQLRKRKQVRVFNIVYIAAKHDRRL